MLLPCHASRAPFDDVVWPWDNIDLLDTSPAGEPSPGETSDYADFGLTTGFVAEGSVTLEGAHALP